MPPTSPSTAKYMLTSRNMVHTSSHLEKRSSVLRSLTKKKEIGEIPPMDLRATLHSDLTTCPTGSHTRRALSGPSPTLQRRGTPRSLATRTTASTPSTTRSSRPSASNRSTGALAAASLSRGLRATAVPAGRSALPPPSRPTIARRMAQLAISQHSSCLTARAVIIGETWAAMVVARLSPIST